MNATTTLFKPTDVVLKLGEAGDEKQYRLIYDLNAFCELEKMYDSVDSVLQMLLGVNETPDMNEVTYKGEPVLAEDVQVAGTALASYIAKVNNKKEAKHADTLNLLWIGTLHDHAVYNDFDEITGYSISKAKLGAIVTFKNLREVNAKIVTAILRDLLPPVNEAKNEEASERLTLTHKTEAQ